MKIEANGVGLNGAYKNNDAGVVVPVTIKVVVKKLLKDSLVPRLFVLKLRDVNASYVAPSNLVPVGNLWGWSGRIRTRYRRFRRCWSGFLIVSVVGLIGVFDGNCRYSGLVSSVYGQLYTRKVTRCLAV